MWRPGQTGPDTGHYASFTAQHLPRAVRAQLDTTVVFIMETAPKALVVPLAACVRQLPPGPGAIASSTRLPQLARTHPKPRPGRALPVLPGQTCEDLQSCPHGRYPAPRRAFVIVQLHTGHALTPVTCLVSTTALARARPCRFLRVHTEAVAAAGDADFGCVTNCAQQGQTRTALDLRNCAQSVKKACLGLWLGFDAAMHGQASPHSARVGLRRIRDQQQRYATGACRANWCACGRSPPHSAACRATTPRRSLCGKRRLTKS